MTGKTARAERIASSGGRGRSERGTRRFAVIAALGALAALTMAGPAEAACTKMAFSVNDYGKEGPTRDAKALLDKHIAATMAKRGIKGYRVGKKTVTCELFLDFIIFDEHTCKAEATVCWRGPDLDAVRKAPKAPAKSASKSG